MKDLLLFPFHRKGSELKDIKLLKGFQLVNGRTEVPNQEPRALLQYVVSTYGAPTSCRLCSRHVGYSYNNTQVFVLLGHSSGGERCW